MFVSDCANFRVALLGSSCIRARTHARVAASCSVYDVRAHVAIAPPGIPCWSNINIGSDVDVAVN